MDESKSKTNRQTKESSKKSRKISKDRKGNKKTSIMEQAKLAKKVDKHDNDLIDDIIEMLRYKRKQSVIKGKAQEEPVELAEEQDMILETEERELLQRQIDRITFVDDAPDKSNNLPTEERELMEDFRNKLVQELEDFNKNVDKTLKVAGELRLERLRLPRLLGERRLLLLELRKPSLDRLRLHPQLISPLLVALLPASWRSWFFRLRA